MKSLELYNSYKKENEEVIIIVKEGIFYKTYNKDALIMWYLFDYVYKDDVVSFGNNSYDKVVDKLKKSEISFIIVDGEGKIIEFSCKSSNYQLYFGLANTAYQKKIAKESLVNKVKLVLDKVDCYEEIDEYLNKFIVD